jgi:hypothetical protein
LEIMDKLVRNTVRNPSDEMFRKIRLSNPKIAASITDVEGAVNALTEMGWVSENEEMVLPPNVRLVHERDVVGILNAQDFYKKEAENEAKRRAKARKEVDAEREALLKQAELDRREKSAEGPVMHGSVAKKLGDGQVVRAGDIGIGKNGGG